MLTPLRSSMPSLPPRMLTTTPTRTSSFARTFFTSSILQDATEPAKRVKITKRALKKLGIDESLLPPKKPPLAFTPFRSEFSKSMATSKPMSEVSKEAGKAWRELSDAEKKVYLDRAAKELAEYKIKYQEWIDNVHPSVIEKMNRLKRQNGDPTIQRARSDGIVKPLMSYNQFSRDFYKKYTEEHGPILRGGEQFTAFMKRTREAWNNLPEAERDVYRERYQKEKAQYLSKLDRLDLKTATTQSEKPSTPYLMFKSDFQKKYIKEHGDVSQKELSQLTRDAWKKLSVTKKHKTANSKTQSAIKKPSSPYITFKNKFQKKYIKEHGEVSQEVLAQLAKDAWKKLSAGRKNGYMKRYETKKAEYLAKMDKDKLK